MFDRNVSFLEFSRNVSLNGKHHGVIDGILCLHIFSEEANGLCGWDLHHLLESELLNIAVCELMC